MNPHDLPVYEAPLVLVLNEAQQRQFHEMLRTQAIAEWPDLSGIGHICQRQVEDQAFTRHLAGL